MPDLASEIFGRLKQLNDEQRAKDYEQQNQLVKLYSSFANQVEPDSMGPYLQGFEKLMFPSGMKVKGFDQKGFMNAVRAFSGMPSEDFGTRLGTEFRDLTSKFVGPGKARQVRGGADVARLFNQPSTPRTPEQQQNINSRIQAEGDLSKGIVLRDPQEEALEKLRTQYGIQYQNKVNELALREENMRERQRINDERDFANRWEIGQHNATIRSRQDIEKEAMEVAGLGGRRYPRDEDYDQAIGNISRRKGLNEDVVRERAGYLRSRAQETRRTVEAGGLKPSDVDRRFKQFSTEKNRYSSEMSQRVKAKTDLDRTLQDINTILGTGFGGYTYKYNPDAPPDQKVQVVNRPPNATENQIGVMKGFVLNKVIKAGLLNKLREAQGKYSEADEASQRYFKNLLAPEYREYFNATDEQMKGLQYTGDIEQFMRRGKAPSKPSGPQATPRTMMGKGLIRIPYTAIPDYQFDQMGKRVVTWKGNSYLIIGETPGGALIGKIQK